MFTCSPTPARCSQVVVKSLPTFFTRYLEAKSAVVEPFLLALALDLQSAPPGLLSTFRPPTVQSLLASKACRGAVMFGTRLSRGEAAAIISDLRFTALPFQCAHGRVRDDRESFGSLSHGRVQFSEPFTCVHPAHSLLSFR